jgi:hypothetical protein
MSFEEEIKDRFQTDSKSILQNHMDEFKGIFEFHEDGTTDLSNECRQLRPKYQILLYLIAQRYKSEADIADSDQLDYSFFYKVFSDKDESTVRGYLMDLRQEGLVTKTEGSAHSVVVERIPDAIDRIHGQLDS